MPSTRPDPTRDAVRLLAIAGFFSSTAIRICDGLIPRLSDDFAISPGRAGASVTAFAIAYGVLQLVFGPLGDRFGKARTIAACVFGSGLAAAACALSRDWSDLLWTRALWGAAAAGVVPLAMAWIGDAVPLEQRQQTLARLLFGNVGGMMFGQLAGGLFADAGWGWRGAFAVTAVGHLAVGLLLVSRMRLLNVAAAPPDRGVRYARQFATVFEQRWARTVLAACLLEGTLLFGGLTYMPVWLQQRHGLSLTAASAQMALFAAGGMLYALTVARVVATLGQVRMVLLGTALMGAGFAAWLLSPLAWTAGIVAFLVGYGMYLFHATLQTHGTQMAPTARGTAVSLFAGALFTGQALGTWIAGHLHDGIGPWAPLVAPIFALPVLGLAFAGALKRRRT